MKKACILLIALALLSGCGEPPKDARLMNEGTNQKTESPRMDTLDHIWSNYQEVLKKDYASIQLDKDITIEKPEAVSVLSMTQRSDMLDKSKEIMSAYIPKEHFHKKYYTANPKTDPPGPEYVNKKTGEMCLIGNNGFLTYEENSMIGDYDKNGRCEEAVYLNRNYKDKEVQVRDGKVRISQGIKMAQKQVDKWNRLSNDTFQPRIRRVMIYPYHGKKNCKILKYFFERTYKGVNILNERRTVGSGGMKPLSTTYISYFDDEVLIGSTKRAESFLCSVGEMTAIKEIKRLDKIITLETATNLVEKEMASYHTLKVSKIALSYRLVNSRGDTDGGYGAGERYKTSPCWVFYMSEDPDSEEFVLVDCQTGAVDYIINY